MPRDPHHHYRKLDPEFVLQHRATLVTSVDGGPLRTLIKGAARHATGMYPSAKARRPQFWKAHDELAKFHVCEVDTSVLTYLAQPHRIDFHLPKGPVSFFADLRIERADGTVEIEATPSPKSVDVSDVPRWAREVYDALGWRFRQRVSADRAADAVREANARIVEADRFAVVPPQALSVVHRTFGLEGRAIAYDDLAELLGAALGSVPRGRAVMHAMIVGRHLTLDLSIPIRSRTPIRLCPHSPDPGP